MPAKSKTEQEALKYISEATTDRQLHIPWQRDVYRYCMPWRKRPMEWKQQHDQDDLFDSTAIEALNDFSADMQSTFTPIEDDWLDIEPAESLQGFTVAQLAPKLKEYQTAIFSEVRRSNFHEATQEAYPDLAAGTCAMVIQDYDINAPFQCQAIPITDLLITRGVYGGVDFRARVIANMRLTDIKVTYPRATLSADLETKIKNATPGMTVICHECVWRIWDPDKIERWQYVLLIDNVECETDVFEGPGSNPIIVTRWRTDSTTAWGVGPLYTVLPTIKTLDQLNYLIMKHLSFAVDPAGFYDDDGVINLENGIDPGKMIPRAIGSKIEPYESRADFQTSFFEREDMQHDIKRALFQDKPAQSGDTPPTAAQWMDQKAEVARRMGAPFGRMTTEWQHATFQRFAYLMTRRGTLPEIRHDGRLIRLRPQSPLIKAQRQQKVVVGGRLLEMIGQYFGPDAVHLLVDAPKTLARVQDGLGDDIVVLRSEQEIAAMAQQGAAIAQQTGMVPGGQSGAPPAANAA